MRGENKLSGKILGNLTKPLINNIVEKFRFAKCYEPGGVAATLE